MIIILILHIASIMIWAGNIALNLSKYERMFCIVEIFNQFILIAYHKTSVILYTNNPICIFEMVVILGLDDNNNKDKYDNS